MSLINRIVRRYRGTSSPVAGELKQTAGEDDTCDDDVIDVYFDPAFYVAHNDVPQHVDPRRHFLEQGDGLRYRPSCKFDPDFYARRYPDIVAQGLAPFAHFRRFGLDNGFFPNRFKELESRGLDRILLEKRIFGPGSGAPREDVPFELAFESYLLQAARPMSATPSRRFDSAFYRARYPDVRRAQVDPLIHYLEAGHAEGRRITGDIVDTLKDGGKPVDPGLPTIAVVVHELTLTGAPVVGLDLVKAYSKDHNVVCLSARGGKLEQDMIAHTVAYCLDAGTYSDFHLLIGEVTSRFTLRACVVNSVEATYALPSLHAFGVPAISLIHEFEQYTFPDEKIDQAIFYSDHLIFSSDLVRRSWDRAVYERYGFHFRHYSIQHQSLPAATMNTLAAAAERDRTALVRDLETKYRISLAGRRVVMGGGSVAIRKGVDLFVATAGILRQLQEDDPDAGDVVFLWVGDGRSTTDMHFGLWFEEQARTASNLVMLPANPDFHDFMLVADVFFCSSRLDPFPNVVIDAVALGRIVALFDGATGCPEALDRIDVPYISIREFNLLEAATKILAYLNSDRKQGYDTDTRRRIRDEFVNDHLTLAVEDRLRAITALEQSVADDALAALVDPEFMLLPIAHALFGRANDPALKARFWRRSLVSGNCYYNPAPGFNARILPKTGATGGPVAPTHAAVDLGAAGLALGNRARAIVHYHAFHVDAFDLFLRSYGGPIAQAGSVVVTTDTEEKRAALLATASAAGLAVDIEVMPNRGRDYGPFFALLESGRFDGADIVGHLHAKRSPEIGSEAVRGWERYLYDTLLAEDHFAKICGLFETDARLALVFPDDQHSLGWGRNKEFADALCRFPLPDEPCQFPMGSMFFIGRNALEAAWDGLAIGLDDMPPEPVPYDGSPLHAIERLWPILVTEQGRSFATVYRRGLSR